MRLGRWYGSGSPFPSLSGRGANVYLRTFLEAAAVDY